jgi:hypothetical protein
VTGHVIGHVTGHVTGGKNISTWRIQIMKFVHFELLNHKASLAAVFFTLSTTKIV